MKNIDIQEVDNGYIVTSGYIPNEDRVTLIFKTYDELETYLRDKFKEGVNG